MSSCSPKHTRIRFEPSCYEELCRQVLQRDGWRGQDCGVREQLQVHHRRFRSHRGADSRSISSPSAPNVTERLMADQRIELGLK